MSAPWWEQVRLAEEARLRRVGGWRAARAEDRRSPDFKRERSYASATGGPRPVTRMLDGRVVGGAPRPAPAAVPPGQRTPAEQARRARDMLMRSAPPGWRVSGSGVGRPA